MAHTFDKNIKMESLIPPADQGDINTSWVQPFSGGTSADRAVFLIHTGTVGTSLDMALYQATDATGTGRKAITSAALVQVTPSNDNAVATIEIGPGALDGKNGFKFVRAEILVSGADTDNYGVLLIHHRLRYPGLDDQPASYNQQVVVLG